MSRPTCRLLSLTICIAIVSAAHVASSLKFDPPRPSFPAAYVGVQVSLCVAESVFCPAGFLNSTIVSQTYYDYPNRLMGAGDLYDLNTDVAYVSDQTFITQFNATHLATDIYFLTSGASQVSCFRTLYESNFTTPDVLGSAQYVGLDLYNGVKCYKFLSAQGMYWFVTVDTEQLYGFTTSDSSQHGFIQLIRDQPIQPKVWTRPASVPCPVVSAEKLMSLRATPASHVTSHMTLHGRK